MERTRSRPTRRSPILDAAKHAARVRGDRSARANRFRPRCPRIGTLQKPPIPWALEWLTSFIRSTRLAQTRTRRLGFTRATSICRLVHQQLIDHGHVECIEQPPASTSGLHTLRSLYH